MTTLAPQETLGRYQLLDELGRGAQATVWRARDPQLQREVALKIWHGPGDDDAAGGLIAEARLAAGLRHAGIVPLFDVLQDKGRLVTVAECVAGPTLAEHLQRHGALPPRDAVHLAQALLDALAHAHGQGVVHRDLKASNVLLGDEDRKSTRLNSSHEWISRMPSSA